MCENSGGCWLLEGGVPSSQGLCPWEEEVDLFCRWGPARPPGGDGGVVSPCGFLSSAPELSSGAW